MSTDTNPAMADALRLTRAGRVGEATALLQRSLGIAGTAAQPDSSVARPPSDRGRRRLPAIYGTSLGQPRFPGGAQPSGRRGAASAAAAAGGEIRHLTYTDAPRDTQLRRLRADGLCRRTR